MHRKHPDVTLGFGAFSQKMGIYRNYSTTVVGLDVHKDSIVAAVLQPEARHFASTKIANEPAEVRKFVDRLARFSGQPHQTLRAITEVNPGAGRLFFRRPTVCISGEDASLSKGLFS